MVLTMQVSGKSCKLSYYHLKLCFLRPKVVCVKKLRKRKIITEKLFKCKCFEGMKMKMEMKMKIVPFCAET